MNKYSLFLLLFITTSIFANEAEKIEINQIYSPKGNINLRANPPRSIFYILGEKKGLVNTNSLVKVVGVEEVNTLVNKHYWLNIETMNPDTQVVEKGWIYAGRAGENLLVEKVR